MELTDIDKKSMHKAGYSHRALELMNKNDYIMEVENSNVCHTCKNPQGEDLRFCIKVGDGNIVDASYSFRGCPALAATAAAIVELVLGNTLENAKSINVSKVRKFLGSLPPGHEEHIEFSVNVMKETVNIYSNQKQLTFAEHKVYKHICGVKGSELDEIDIIPCEDCPLIQNCENDHIIIHK